MTMPSINWCGSISISGRSLQVPGSLSSALQMTYFALGESFGTKNHFIPVGKPAPPRPRRFDFFTSSMIESGVISFSAFSSDFVAALHHVDIELVRILHAPAAADERSFQNVAVMQGARNYRLRLRAFARVEILDDAVKFEGRQILVEVVIHLHGRSAGASADAFDFLQREDAVLRGFLVAYLETLLGALQDFVATLEHARDVGADLHVMLAHGLAVQHRIVGQRFFDLHVVQVEAPGDFNDHFVADVAEFVLRVHQHGNQGAALDRIPGLQLLEFRRKFGGKFHGYLSTSPSTMSIVPMQAITSAINCPSMSLGSACKLINEGARKCTRSGFGEPSLATKQPSSPRGDSTATKASPGCGENPSVKILKW